MKDLELGTDLFVKGKFQPEKWNLSSRRVLDGAGWVAGEEGREICSGKKVHII